MGFFNKKGRNGDGDYDFDSYSSGSTFYRPDDDSDDTVDMDDYDDDTALTPESSAAKEQKVAAAPAQQVASCGPKLISHASYQDGPVIVGYLKEGYCVVLNIEELETTKAQRLIVYLMGALEALDGELKRASKSTFALAPKRGMVQDVGGGQAT